MKPSFAAQMTGLVFITGLLSAACSTLPAQELPTQDLSETQATLACEDFLEKWDKKPPQLEFTGCEQTKSAQAALVASYSVTGSAAAQIEDSLIKDFGMAPLSFVCCGWENHVPRPPDNSDNQTTLPPIDPLSREGRYIDEHEFDFSIAMYSEETLVQERSDWAEIPIFHVRVKTYLGGV